jgi:hypothetical protein
VPGIEGRELEVRRSGVERQHVFVGLRNTARVPVLATYSINTSTSASFWFCESEAWYAPESAQVSAIVAHAGQALITKPFAIDELGRKVREMLDAGQTKGP